MAQLNYFRKSVRRESWENRKADWAEGLVKLSIIEIFACCRLTSIPKSGPNHGPGLRVAGRSILPYRRNGCLPLEW